MSKENLATVRGIYAEWEKGNLRAALPALDPELTFVTFMPDSNEVVVAHGIDELAEFMREWFNQWAEYRLMAEEVVEPDDEHVLVVGHHTARGRQSSVEVRDRVVTAWRFRDVRVVQLVIGRDRDQVVEAAGLSERSLRRQRIPRP